MSDGNSKMLGKYELLGRLATGGMAEIYLARQTGIGGFKKLVVVKRILPHLARKKSFVEMFLDEAVIAAQLNHPNVVQINDLGQVGKEYFIAMEYLEGESLGHLASQGRREKKPMTPGLASAVVEQVCEALHYAHTFRDETGQALNIVHRDVSPHNIIVLFTGVVKLVDFGIAKAETKLHQTRTGTIKGKMAYMAPEHLLDRPLDGRSDIFALGVVLWELLARRRLFKRGNDPAIIRAIMDEPIPSLCVVREGIPEQLADVVDRALRKNPDDRFQTAADMGQAIKRSRQASAAQIGVSEIADYMAEVFGDRARIRQKLLGGIQKGDIGSILQELKPGSDSLPSATASRDEPSGGRDSSPVAAGESEVPTRVNNSSSGESPSVAVPIRRSRTGLLMIVFLLVLVISASVAWLFLNGLGVDSRPGPGPDHEQGNVRSTELIPIPSAPKPAPTAPVIEPSAIHLASSPVGAKVLEGGRLVGKTPLDIKLHDGQRRVVELRLTGYKSAERVIEAGSGQQVFVKLYKVVQKTKKRGKRRKTRPASKNRPKPKAADEDFGVDLYDI